MARLNEPAAPSIASAASSTSTEAVESLKRRFLRQNRELARVNSNQSVKIRNLETQISQLVAENCQLRSESNQLRLALDESRAKRTFEHVDGIKRQLQDSLKGFEELIGSLGEVGKKRKSTSRRSEVVRSPRQSPGQKTSRYERGIGDVIDLPQNRQVEGWLPTIVEDKHFPRRTMEPADVSALIDPASSDSPDIGPPPTTFLDRRKSLEDLRDGASEELESTQLPDFLSANFETRRRRRETHVRRDSSLVSALDLSPSKDPSRSSELLSSQPVRSGAKRKLDLADRPSDARETASDADTLTFRRKREEAKITATEPVKTSPVRKVLAPKPVNTDPVVISPRKITGKDKPDEKVKPSKEPGRRQSRVEKPAAPQHITIPRPEDLPVIETEIHLDPIKLEPKTPHGIDLFSPVSTQPSENRPEIRSGTPPPSDLGARNAADAAAAGRGSRRARNPVSYAEPSLVSKMRRPGKEMVAAVVPGDRRASSKEPEVKPETVEIPSTQDRMRTVVLGTTRNMAGAGAISVAVGSAESTRPEPGSPLGEKLRSDGLEAEARKGLEEAQLPARDTTSKRRQSGITAADTILASEHPRPLAESTTAQPLDVYDIESSLSTSSDTGTIIRPKSQGSSRPSSAGSIASTTSTTSGHRPSALERSRSSADLTKARTSRRQSLSASSDSGRSMSGPLARDGVSRFGPASAAASGKLENARRRPEKLEERTGAVGRRRSMML